MLDAIPETTVIHRESNTTPLVRKTHFTMTTPYDY